MAAVTAWVTAGLASAPARLGGGESLDVSLGRIVVALIVCLALAGFAALLLKRGRGRIEWPTLARWAVARTERRIEVIEIRRISPHADVCLFRCDEQDYLVLSSAAELRLLRQTAAQVKTP